MKETTPVTNSVIIVGTGLAGMVAGYEAIKGGKHVIFLEQENRNNLGGQAFWSLGGLFYVNSPEQSMMRVKDSEELAWRDWANSADYDPVTEENRHDYWGKKWGREYVRFAANEKRSYLKGLGLNVLPTIGWAERGSGDASGHGNSVPRFHLTWGTGPEVVRVFREPLLNAEEKGQVEFHFRHRVDELVVENDESGRPRVVGVRGSVLSPTNQVRGEASPRDVVKHFELRGSAVVIATGGIGGNLEKVRKMWPTERWGTCPKELVTGVPAHVDGRGIDIAQNAGASVVNTDRMWAYTEGMTNWNPIWPGHGIRIIPGPSALWLDAEGNRLPTNLFPGTDNLAALAHIGRTGHGYSWFVLNKAIVDKEFIFSGSEQNPDLTDKEFKKLAGKLGPGTHVAVKAFMDNGIDWVVEDDLADLVAGMNRLVPEGSPTIEEAHLKKILEDRDSQLDNPFSKDAQVNYIRVARGFLGDKLIRVAPPHRILDESKGPLIAVRLTFLTRKTLGGLETNLDGQCLNADGTVLPGLYACGEASGFGGGGMHGKNALEGTFLGGCIHSGKRVGEALAQS
ncbi:FAD-binding dehydrogenase [Corynebacterium minutissimum]|uniref:FAD-binding dehydrogenase n=1 Tax=Corynebacterium minutissimum TaxID=38301 RepID=UPI001EF23368|nr:FAD-binding dehydrogenase [Corynebacterium minutissimum]MCG7228650.1 FAD-binding dehydrogenase [Corynebacterium minutissimum]MCG7237767.1 FAD-binding dehydrogenase [Corynebacterium minutissimum]